MDNAMKLSFPLNRDVSTSPDTGSISDDEADSDHSTQKRKPIGVFWDIENCQVPRGKSATAVAHAIRSKFFQHYREVEFVVVCDVMKEHPKILEELNYAQVNLVHVSATCKNAADDKLRQLMRHFGQTYQPGAAIVLISGDINYSTDLIELRHRRLMYVVLLHNENVSQNLLFCANEHYSFSDIVERLPDRESIRDDILYVDVYVTNLPHGEPSNRVKARLKYLCNNVGGRVGFTNRFFATIRFPTYEHAVRNVALNKQVPNLTYQDNYHYLNMKKRKIKF